MAYRWTESDLQTALNRTKAMDTPLRGSKYRNQKVVVNGEKFDSKREAAYYQELLLREKAGEVRFIERQITFHLCCPELDAMFRQAPIPKVVYVCDYVADFTFEEVAETLENGSRNWRHVVVDVKGAKTPMYLLKKKWLELQSGIRILEVR